MLAVIPEPYTRCESSNDNEGDGDYGVQPGKYREGENGERKGAKSCIEVVILDRIFDEAQAVVVGLDTEFGHGYCWKACVGMGS